MDRQEWFTATEAAEFLRVNRSTIYRMARAGQLRYHVLPGGVGRRFHRNDLEAALGAPRGTNPPHKEA
ncbi:MAG TPA: helix-turn-helix domain-containing protein [Candidatus Binatia bacterium]|nr:helix-turn-helix domain-containing protein [Candidatus Binatia bacterium]